MIDGSVSGSTSAGGLNRLLNGALSQPGIDLIILGLGANDMLKRNKPNAETEKNLEEHYPR